MTILASVYTVLGSYILVLASLSPTPPLYDSDVGSVIIVSTVESGVGVACEYNCLSSLPAARGIRVNAPSDQE